MKTTTDRFTAYLEMLDTTQHYSAENIIYNSYIEGDSHFMTEHEADVSVISATLDEKVGAGTVTDFDLAEYEEAARRAGFYAGFRSAVAYIHLLQQQSSI